MDNLLKEVIIKDSMYWDRVMDRIEKSLPKESDYKDEQ